MTHDNIVAYEVLADRIKKLGEYRDYLTRLAALSEKLPDEQRGVLLQKVARIADFVEEPQIYGEPQGDVLVISWGSTYGTVLTVVERLIKAGKKVSFYHLRWLNPLPHGLETHLQNFKKVLVPEINLGQLRQILRSRYLIDVTGFNKVRGLPISVQELQAEIEKMIEEL